MGQTTQKLKISEEITSASFVAIDLDVIPPTGSKVYISKFVGAADFGPDAIVKLVWKFDHATESEIVLWSTKGEGSLPDKTTIDSTHGLPDGVRNLAIVCENAEPKDIFMSAFAHVEVTT